MSCTIFFSKKKWLIWLRKCVPVFPVYTHANGIAIGQGMYLKRSNVEVCSNFLKPPPIIPFSTSSHNSIPANPGNNQFLSSLNRFVKYKDEVFKKTRLLCLLHFTKFWEKEGGGEGRIRMRQTDSYCILEFYFMHPTLMHCYHTPDPTHTG